MLLSLLLASTLNAAKADIPNATEMVWDTHTHSWLKPEDVAALLEPGEILVVGEDHAFDGDAGDPEIAQHHTNQVRLLKSLSAKAVERGAHLNLGMEFLLYTVQDTINDYLDGKLTEAEFIKKAQWNGADFPSYRRQILEPHESSGATWGLNLPNAITHQVTVGGKDSLTSEQRQLLPPIWERGRDDYFQRISEMLGGHSGMNLENMFWAQSLWDDTMAWNATKRSLGLDTLAIIVGEVHVDYGQGLPSRLKRYGARKVTTLVQAFVEKWDEKSVAEAIEPSPKYGETADLIWVFTLPPRK